MKELYMKSGQNVFHVLNDDAKLRTGVQEKGRIVMKTYKNKAPRNYLYYICEKKAIHPINDVFYTSAGDAKAFCKEANLKIGTGTNYFLVAFVDSNKL